MSVCLSGRGTIWKDWDRALSGTDGFIEAFETRAELIVFIDEKLKKPKTFYKNALVVDAIYIRIPGLYPSHVLKHPVE
jgi:hypothetical protein